jgi:hypothetical protein
VALVRKRTIPTERPPLVGEVVWMINEQIIKNCEDEIFVDSFEILSQCFLGGLR